MEPIESKESMYREYTSILIPWLNEQIDKSRDKIARFKVEYILDRMGPKFKKDVSVYKNKKDINIRILWELKYLFWPDGIVVNGAKSNREDILTFRKTTSDDQSPPYNLTQDIENTFYIKEFTTEIVSEDPFSSSDEDIKNMIDSLNLPDGAISIAKISNWQKAPYK